MTNPIASSAASPVRQYASDCAAIDDVKNQKLQPASLQLVDLAVKGNARTTSGLKVEIPLRKPDESTTMPAKDLAERLKLVSEQSVLAFQQQQTFTEPQKLTSAGPSDRYGPIDQGDQAKLTFACVDLINRLLASARIDHMRMSEIEAEMSKKQAEYIRKEGVTAMGAAIGGATASIALSGAGGAKKLSGLRNERQAIKQVAPNITSHQERLHSLENNLARSKGSAPEPSPVSQTRHTQPAGLSSQINHRAQTEHQLSSAHHSQLKHDSDTPSRAQLNRETHTFKLLTAAADQKKTKGDLIMHFSSPINAIATGTGQSLTSIDRADQENMRQGGKVSGAAIDSSKNQLSEFKQMMEKILSALSAATANRQSVISHMSGNLSA
ncbi:IpaC/SipC family type III secretion system effector [Biostraticola tofi]|uniref:IpaC/SipC-like invasin protein C n=1 Tax=Biostraticola tofi TaxID=466109 RepID=A0A4R3YW18_9GAMM|nr:IpaC/SipC family type III secretion system effector [Biostraticola tofi]TCV96676.1 IpaC/SipC-like invasin protein C [Biostraticola tofi]